MNSAPEGSNCKDRVVICIGDLHGYIFKLQSLWSNLQSRLPSPAFESALVIFLGDYCDRGPDTRLVLDFLISLPSLYPKQTHVFLCGNHDFAFAAFVGALPPPPDGSSFSATWAEFQANEEREGWFKGTGLRICISKGGDGVAASRIGSIRRREWITRALFMMHRPFSNRMAFRMVPLIWLKQSLTITKCFSRIWSGSTKRTTFGLKIQKEGRRCCKLIAVHAGLVKGKGVENQLKQLKAKDTSIQKVEALSGRKNVWDIPKELTETPTIIVSGHHGQLHIEGRRLIIDQGGGFEQNPAAAIILPSMEVVLDTDVLPAGK